MTTRNPGGWERAHGVLCSGWVCCECSSWGYGKNRRPGVRFASLRVPADQSDLPRSGLEEQVVAEPVILSPCPAQLSPETSLVVQADPVKLQLVLLYPLCQTCKASYFSRFQYC